MKKRSIWIIISSAILIIAIVIVTSLVYASHFAAAVNAPHTAPGIATANPNSTPITGARTFQIVPAQSTASYSVYENLIIQNKPNNDAIGNTNSVTGSFQIRTGDSPLVASMNIKVDLRTLQSDSSMRDRHVQDSLDTNDYPYASFISVSTQGLPANYSDGQNVHFQLIGNLTMHGKTNKETFDVQGKVAGKTITGTATSTIYMTDFGIQPPNLANIAVSQNKVQISLKFTAQEA